jgi:transcriptional regulator with XRE-family HTH domain
MASGMRDEMMKQKDVAKILNLKSAGMISRWEKGVCLPNLVNASKLAGLYCVLVDALFFPLIRLIKRKVMQRQNEKLKHFSLLLRSMSRIILLPNDPSSRRFDFPSWVATPVDVFRP